MSSKKPGGASPGEPHLGACLASLLTQPLGRPCFLPVRLVSRLGPCRRPTFKECRDVWRVPGSFGRTRARLSFPEHARFLIAHMKGAQGEDGIVRAATFKKLHTPFPESDYAQGWGVAEREWARGSTLTHNGSNTMWFHTVWVAPGRNIAIVAATNIAGRNAPGVVDSAVGVILTRFEASEDSGEGL